MIVIKLRNAYATISDSQQRRDYDMRWPSIRDRLRTQQEAEKREMEAAQADEKRAAEAAQAEKERTVEARARKQKEDTAREGLLRNLEQSRRRYDSDIFEMSRATWKLEADLKRLKVQDEEDVRKEKERNGWWAYFTSPTYGQEKETDEQKQKREENCVHRIASRRIKENELAEKRAKLKKLQDILSKVNGRIAAEKMKVEDEKFKAEAEARARKLQEETARAMREAQERADEFHRQRAERAAKEAREAKAAFDAWQAQERAREAQERARAAAERRREQEADELAEAAARARERAEQKATAREAAAAASLAAAAAKRARKARNERASQQDTRSGTSACRHDGWWSKVEGTQPCVSCQIIQKRFALQCPQCKMVACASCQKTLMGVRWNGEAGQSRRRHRDGDIPFFDYD